MKVTGSATVGAPRERVFAALRDPAVLARTIPGCQKLEPDGPDAYRMTISAGVAAIRGTYSGEVALSDPEPPAAFTLRARGHGAPGTVDATVLVRLEAVAGDGAPATRIDYDADATVGGMVGGVGQRLLAGAAKKTAAEFFAAVGEALTTPAATPGGGGPAVPGDLDPAPAPAAVGDPEAPGVSAQRPAPARRGGSAAPPVPDGAGRGAARRNGTAALVLAAGAAGTALGAAAALAGVALGAALTRRRAR